MIVQLENNIVAKDFKKITGIIESLAYSCSEVKTRHGYYLIGIGKKEFDIRSIGHLKGVMDVHRVSDNYKLVSRKWKVNPTVIDLGDDVHIGNGLFSIMAGPCSIENEEQIENMVVHLKKNNIKIMRGGVFKPRSSPYAFRGLGIDGLKSFYKIASSNGIKIITEVMQVSQIAEMADYVDVFQVGTRNSQNFNLLDELGKTDKPVLLKRGMSGTLEELLQAAEYIFSNGNESIILCERGIRTFEKSYRNTLDLNAIPILKEKTHLPVVFDPSHGIGIRKHIEKMALAGLFAGADGLLVEVHEQPEQAISDGHQTLNFRQAEQLYHNIGMCYELRKSLR